MKKGILLLGFLLASSLVAVSADFDPKEPISLDLKDAKIADVIQTLGALANLPVVVDPDVEGTVTIQLHDPYDVALEKLSAATGVRIVIDNGRLIASRGLKIPPAAPPLPEEFRNARRILLSEYHKAASNPPPLIVRVTWRGRERCYRANFRKGEGRLLEVPLTGSDETGSLVIALVDYDPILQTSYFAVEGPGGGLARVFALGRGSISFSSGSGDDVLRVVTSTDAASSSCTEHALADSAVGTSLAVVRMEGRSVAEGKPSRVLFAPRVQTKAGAIFKTFSGGADPDSGEHRGFVVAGYLARDGKAAALLFKARSTWTDPKDGQEYYFTQSVVDPESRFIPLTRQGVVALKLSPGVGTDAPVELRVFGEE